MVLCGTIWVFFVGEGFGGVLFVQATHERIQPVASSLYLGQMEEKSRGGSGAEKVALTRESGFLCYCLVLGLVWRVLLVNPGNIHLSPLKF